MVTLKPIKNRKNKTTLENFVKPEDSKVIFASKELKQLAKRIKKAKRKQKQIIFQIGAHVIKTGQSLLLIDLMKKGYITHLACNGAVTIHDYEISLIGGTSEDVEAGLKNGTFGMWEETSVINDIINKVGTLGSKFTAGYGEALGNYITQNNEHKDFSLFANAYTLGIPATVHIAIGTDINHMYPNFSPEAAAKVSYLDFICYTHSVSNLQYGVIVNLGSAVILPEVFLKALTIARNQGHKVNKFTAANLDQILHYRPTQNILNRPKPTRQYNIQGKHEETIPTLHAYLTK